MANTLGQKSLKLILPRSLGSKYFIAKLFHLWEGRRDRHEAPRMPQSLGEAGQGRGLVT